MNLEELIKLGFEKEIEESEPSFYYYNLDVVDGLTFITQADDEVKNGEWIVEIFNTYPAIKFKDAEELSELINIINNNINN
jgi:hypothetical protein